MPGDEMQFDFITNIKTLGQKLLKPSSSDGGKIRDCKLYSAKTAAAVLEEDKITARMSCMGFLIYSC